MRMAFQDIGIWHNAAKPGVAQLAERLTHLMEARNMRVRMRPELCNLLGHGRVLRSFSECDLMVVLGGDGTLLSALEVAVENQLPILSINMGRIGFLTEIQPEQLEQDIERLACGGYQIERRMLLEAVSGDQRGFALNEVSFNRPDSAVGVLSLEVCASGTLVDRFSGDGLLVATATGSTAYSLAAGGPIVAPGLECILLTPICPHTFNARPVIIPANETVSVRTIGRERRARVLLDGRRTLDYSEEVQVYRSESSACFVRLHQHNYFDLLRNKLSDWTH